MGVAAAEWQVRVTREGGVEYFEKNVQRIEAGGGKAGQVYGISLRGCSGDSVVFPRGMTAVTRPAKGNRIDIEREVELGGPIHSKGVMILSSFLSARYARNIPLGL